ncbi:hypothetical protein H9P43_004114 [Blastocladiella emersonii ATCC 22665]|nr:hypothetical protein H9P43_004114 [Blastocladiella emersonii ATCC 22665]
MSLLQLLASAVTRCDPSTFRYLLQVTKKQAPQLFDHEDDKWFQHALYCVEETYYPYAYPMSFFNHLALVSIIESADPSKRAQIVVMFQEESAAQSSIELADVLNKLNLHDAVNSQAT